MRVIERGWVSSNSVLLLDDDDSATLVDTGYVTHGAQTLALVRHALQGRRLARIINTHLHSDHCGGNALLSRELKPTIIIPPGHSEAVDRWDDTALGYSACGQACDRFRFDSVLRPGERRRIGGAEWEALASPGHAPHSIILWNGENRTLISADALWEHGFGAIFPEVEGESGFAEQRAILELISRLKPRLVIPGHGAPFTEVDRSLERAFARLDALASDPERNARNVIKTLLKFHLMLVRSVELKKLIQRCEHWHYACIINERYFRLPFKEFITRGVAALAVSGAFVLHNGSVVNKD